MESWAPAVSPFAPVIELGRTGNCPELEALYREHGRAATHAMSSLGVAPTGAQAHPPANPYPWGSASYFPHRAGVGAVQFSMKHDLAAGAAAFLLPLLYDKKAPKKWKRPKLLGSVVAVAAVYLGSRWALMKWWP